MRLPVFRLIILPLLAVWTAAPARAADPGAEGTLRTLGGDLYAGGAVPGASLQPEIRERLDAGLPVTFTYTYLFMRPRRMWLDRTVGERTVARTAAYDPLSALWRLETRINGRAPQVEFTRERADAERFLERLDAVNLGPASMDRPTGAGLRAELQVHFLTGRLLLIPWDLETGWRPVAIIPEAE